MRPEKKGEDCPHAHVQKNPFLTITINSLQVNTIYSGTLLRQNQLET